MIFMSRVRTLLVEVFRVPEVVKSIQARDSATPYQIAASECALLQYEEELLRQPRYDHKLNRFEHKAFSQFGEDGITLEIFRRIGTKTRRFVEIGVGDGLENNTAVLLALGWSGHWIEGSETFVERYIRKNAKGYPVEIIPSFVTAENAQSLMPSGEIDFFSLDIDQNTYWVWNALRNFKPRVVCIEYNASFPAAVDWKVPYEPQRVCDGSSYYGASLKAFELLGRELGYSLVACSISGVNAFFVRDDLVGDHFEAPFTAEHHFEPPRYFLHRRRGHPGSLT